MKPTRSSEDQVGLDRGKRRDVQRRLTRLGFDVHVNGKFDDETRNVIKRWQAVRGYPNSGYLNKAQHAALLSENLASRACRMKTPRRPNDRAAPRSSFGSAAAAGTIAAAAVAGPAASSAA